MAATLSVSEKRFAESVVTLTYCNVFLPERIAIEREALDDHFNASRAERNLHGNVRADHTNAKRLLQRREHLVEALRERLKRTRRRNRGSQLCENLALIVLYYQPSQTNCRATCS